MTTLGWLDSIGVGVFAVSGVLGAARKQLDLFGAMSVAFVCALGGGTLRDLLLGQTPVGWIRDSRPAAIALSSAFAAFVLLRFVSLPVRLLLLLDALGLGLFSVLGAARALDAGASLFVAALMGTLSGVAGGAIRDVLCGDVPLILRSEIYATAALLGAVCFGLLMQLGVEREVALWSGGLLCFVLRMVAIKWNLRLPLARERKPTG
ncbi:trimeric intracellular cation channel family protein [bacterium]|nr:MAG: trimeric intracellular cation channel family protein [bacterium]